MNHDELEIDIFDEDYLAHYGVKGMKWGVRKNPVTGNGRKVSAKVKARLNRASKRTIGSAKRTAEITKARIKVHFQNKRSVSKARSEGKKNSKELRRRQIKDMSNEEIEARIKRIDLENKYFEKTQTRNDRTKTKIKEYVFDAVSNVAKEKSKEYLKAFVDYKLHGGKEVNGSFVKYLNKDKKEDDPLKKEVEKLKLLQDKKRYSDYINGLTDLKGNSIKPDNSKSNSNSNSNSNSSSSQSNDKAGKARRIIRVPSGLNTASTKSSNGPSSSITRGVNPLRVDAERVSSANARVSNAVQSYLDRRALEGYRNARGSNVSRARASMGLSIPRVDESIAVIGNTSIDDVLNKWR